MSWNPGPLVNKARFGREFTPQEVIDYISDISLRSINPVKYKQRLRRLSKNSIRKFEAIRGEYYFELSEKMRRSKSEAGRELAELVENCSGKLYRIYADFFAREVGAYL